MKKIIFGENKNIIHESLRRLRCEKKLTQAQLAAKLQLFGINIDQQMISKIENNRRIVTDYELVCLCRALGCSLFELLSDDVEKNIE